MNKDGRDGKLVDHSRRGAGTATKKELADFKVLLNAVLNTPELVPTLVRESPEILDAVDNCMETVLHWLAVENHVEGIALLHSLGAKVPEHALIHAVEMGHLETVELLLSYGVRLHRYSLDRIVGNPIWGLSEGKKLELQRLFDGLAHRSN